MTAHVFKDCNSDCGRCHICNGCKWCIRCGCAEGELLTFCHGEKLSQHARNAIMTGKVLDLQRARATKGPR